MIQDKAIREVMSTGLAMVSASETVQKAVQEMVQDNIGAVLVEVSQKKVGIFTERDLMKRVVGQGMDLSTTTVGEVMTSKLITVAPETPIKDVIQKMYTMSIRHILIEENGNIIGLFSIRDVMRQLTVEWSS